ncbi:hypothetical protein N7450_005097 [Penicillium hetheringtonii]|uniref:THUMP domain-containing protein n=1 Tax=Penicillium hetheringtonii TaxID=911720 RepID=A0AAD6DR96_9EURO|nr:hypothetical protein N7450_005097 [Penicillium hetheringtonii]
MTSDGKRSMPQDAASSKRRKGPPPKQRINIDAGDAGIFVTCDMGREGKCKAEVLDILSEILEKSEEKPPNEEDEDSDDGDIEAQIQRELAGMQPVKDKTKKRPVEVTRLEMPCVLFARIDSSVDPVELVHRLCTEAQDNPQTKRSRYIKRMTPVVSIRKTLSVELEPFIKEMLRPHFHSGGDRRRWVITLLKRKLLLVYAAIETLLQLAKKGSHRRLGLHLLIFAIRPTIRGNNKFKRDDLIKTIAEIVGPEHSVDLTNYDLTILVEVSQNLMGMSVVQSDYDKLKRYNLAEIYDPSPKGV